MRSTLLLVLALVLALVAGPGLSLARPTPVQAATTGSCGYAAPGTGSYASTICWFDMSSLDPAQAGSSAGQQMTVTLPGGYTLAYTMKATGGPVYASGLPTYGQAFLGNPRTGFYTGIPGKPAVYQSKDGTTSTFTLDDIRMTDRKGNAVSGFALVGADAESTDQSEAVSWKSTSPITSLTATSGGNGLGNACGGGFTGVGTTSVSCVGSSRSVGTKTGTALVSSEAPARFVQEMKGGGKQAVSFGVMVSSLSLTKKVADGYAGDDFEVAIDAADGGDIAKAATGPGGASAATGAQTVVVGNSERGTPFVFSERALAGDLGNYTGNWVCTRNGVKDPKLPSGAAGPEVTVDVHVGDAVDCTITNTAKPATLLLDKRVTTITDVNGNGLNDAGDRIAYGFTVTNTSSVVLKDVTLSDPLLGTVTCPAGDLAPGRSVDCTAEREHTVTQAEQAAGSVDNVATAQAVIKASPGQKVTSPQARTSTPLETPAPKLTLTKAVEPSTVMTQGETVTYSFLVQNTGNVTITGVSVAELSFTGHGTLGAISCPAQRPLAPGESLRCTAPYTVTQADVDSTRIENTAVATGTSPAGETVTSNEDTATLPAPEEPVLELQKTATPETVSEPGATVDYRFRLTNTGNVTLGGLAVQETAFNGSGSIGAVTCPATPLAPGESFDCAAKYTVTEADILAGDDLVNTATASGTTTRSGLEVHSKESTATVTVVPKASIFLTKSVTPGSVAGAGKTVHYDFTVTNTGFAPVDEVVIHETAFSGSGALAGLSCPAGPLAPKASMRCTAEYTVTQADADAGAVDNTAMASATGPRGPVTSNESSARVTIPATPALSLVKTADQKLVTTAGQRVAYTFTLTNTGTVTLQDLAVQEQSFNGAGRMTPVVCPDVPLAPGQSVDCTAAYVVQSNDLTGKPLVNVATASGTSPGGGEVKADRSSASVDTEVTPPTPTPTPTPTDTATPQPTTPPTTTPGGTATPTPAPQPTEDGLSNTGFSPGVWSALFIGLGALVLGLVLLVLRKPQSHR